MLTSAPHARGDVISRVVATASATRLPQHWTSLISASSPSHPGDPASRRAVASAAPSSPAVAIRQSADARSRPSVKSPAMPSAPATVRPAVNHYREQARERFLSPEEYRSVGASLKAAEAEGWMWPPAIAAIRLLMLTGCRKSEILTLRWDDVDRTAGEFRLRDGKRGPRMVPLTTPALKVLDGIERVEGNSWVIRSRKPGIHLPDLTYYWNRIQAHAELEGVRIHDLRHSHASRALALGKSLTMIGRLLGHSKVGATARYAHLARDSVRESAERIAVSIAGDIL